MAEEREDAKGDDAQLRELKYAQESEETARVEHEVEITAEELDATRSVHSSSSHWDPDPGFAHIDGDIQGRGYNETTVDIVTIPCIGASPVETWARVPLADDHIELPEPTELIKHPTSTQLPVSSLLSPGLNRHLPKASPIWVRQGIRKEVSTARVMMYRHRDMTEGFTLDQAANDLLDQLVHMRRNRTKARPFFLICHSIGGLVAKLALVKANEDAELKSLVYECYGMTFFATPHRGSSYLSMSNLRESIQQLLYLHKPLPRTITDELRLGYKPLLDLHEKFVDIASELRIWTFYETVDSQLSGLTSRESDEVHFSAPIVSIKSSLIGTRAEQALSLESNHADCASFGRDESRDNTQTMDSYLCELGRAVRMAENLTDTTKHTPLRLNAKVKLEIIGFYNDPDHETGQDVRLYVSRHALKEFFEKGPEQCLRERLDTMAPKSRRGTAPKIRPSSPSPSRGLDGAIGFISDIGQRILGLSETPPQSPPPPRAGAQSPEIVVTTSHAPRPPITPSASEPTPAPPSQRRSRELTVPAFSTPRFQDTPSRSISLRETSRDRERARFEAPATTDLSPGTEEKGPILDFTHGHDTGKKDHAVENEERYGRASRADALQDLAAGFCRPNSSKRKFMWIHLPYNNPHWVKEIFDALSKSQGQTYSKLLRNDFWVNRHITGRHANFHSSYVKPGCAFVPAEASSPRPKAYPSRSPSPGITPTHLYLYLPYLHYDTYQNIIHRRNVISKRIKHGRSRPVPSWVANNPSLEAQVIWEYIGHDPPLNARRTLDQYGYPSLHDTWARDDDQMLYKLTKERIRPPNRKKDTWYNSPMQTTPTSRLNSIWDNPFKGDLASAPESDGEPEEEPEEDILDGNLLMVDQLWLWAVDKTTLLTFFSKRESHPTEGPLFQQADLRNSIYNELNGDLTGRCDNALDLAAFVTLHAVTVLLDRASHSDLEVFRIFEEALGILTERMTSALKKFRMRTYKDNIGEDTDLSDEGEDGNRSESIKKRHQREIQQSEKENRENTSALLELRDMEDELNTLKTLFEEQQAVVEKMRDEYEKPELRPHTDNGIEYLQEALGRLDEYKKQATDMLERVDTTRKDYEKLLEMVQRKAQVDEVRWSRLQAELASSQNTSVMIFTTFTVIFLPLSFFTSVFGMNTAEWSPSENNTSLKTIGAISLPASAFLIGASLVAAFSSRVQYVFKKIFEFLRSSMSTTKKGVSQLEPRRAKEAKYRRRKQKAEREQVKKKKRDRGYDFWETVRQERRSRYEIPELNRKKATQRRQRMERELEREKIRRGSTWVRWKMGGV